MKPSKIFITHSSNDSATATKIRDYLETNGIKCWMAPRDIPIGEEWAKGILNGINSASGMLLVFSSNSNDSSQVRREIERAIHNDVPIYPVRIEDVQPSDAMEYYISSNHWMDAFGGNFETNLTKLVTAIKSKHNITQESKSEPTSKPVQPKEQSPTPTSQVTDKSSKRKLTFSKLSFKMPRKILFPIAFLFLLVAGYFISKSFENSNPEAITTEVIFPLPSDTINTFVRMIASTDESNDYVAGVKVTEDGNYVIMGYSYVNDYYEGKPWIAMFDSLGNEMWKHEGSILGGEGEFDIYPDGRSVWAYPMVDTMLVNHSGYTRIFREPISRLGEPISIPYSNTYLHNSNQYFGRMTNLFSDSRAIVTDVFLIGDTVYISTVTSFNLKVTPDYEGGFYTTIGNVDNSVMSDNASSGNRSYESFINAYKINEDSFRRFTSEQMPSTDKIYGTSNIVMLDEKLYCAMITKTSMQLHSWVSFTNDSTGQCLAEESKIRTYNILEEGVSDDLSQVFLLSNNNNEFVLVSLFSDGNIYCLKVDEDGNEIWLKSFSSSSNNDAIFGATFVNDAYFIFGQSYSLDTGNYDGYLLKIDEEGSVVWEQTYDFGDWENLWGVEGTSDGGLILVLQSEVNGTSDVFLLKADALGNIPELNSSRNLLYEDWSSNSTIQDNWQSLITDRWNISNQNEFEDNSCLTVKGNTGIHNSPFSANSSFSLYVKMGSLGYVNLESKVNFLRLGLIADGYGSKDNFFFGPLLDYGYYFDSDEFPILYYTMVNDTTRMTTAVPYLDKTWFHWDFDNNESFESCGRIGVGYFNGDSIVVGRVEPDTAWVEFGVLNDFEIKINGNAADYFINDSLFFHTDEFVCDSDSLYLYLGGASNTIPNAIGEVRVTSE